MIDELRAYLEQRRERRHLRRNHKKKFQRWLVAPRLRGGVSA